MNLRKLVFAGGIVAGMASMSAATYFSADFSQGMPKTVKTSYTGADVDVKTGYKQMVTNTWTVLEAGTKGNAAVCATFTNKQEESTRTMTLPEFKVEDASAVLRWQARSFIAELAEAYRIDVKNTATNETVTIFSTEAEAAWWKWHIVSLKDFAGQNVEVSFVCTSNNKYLLAVDDIYAGVPDATLFDVNVSSPVFQSISKDGFVSGTMMNLGNDPKFTKLIVKVDGKNVGESAFTGNMPVMESSDFSVSIQGVDKNVKKTYILYGVNNAGVETKLAEGLLYLSDFRRRNVIDEATGLWCTNCPSGTIIMENQERTFGEQAIVVAAHENPTLDKMTVYDYQYPYMQRAFAAPAYALNKNTANGYITTKWETIESNLFKPTIMRIDIVSGEYDKESDMINVNYEVEFASDVDNSQGRYRLGFQFTHTVFDPTDATLYQSNGQQNKAIYEQFYFLPNRIPYQLAVFNHVNVSPGEWAFLGFEDLLASEYKANTPVEGTISLGRPAEVSELDEGRLIMFVLDTQTGLKYEDAANPDSAFNGPVYVAENAVSAWLKDLGVDTGNSGGVDPIDPNPVDPIDPDDPNVGVSAIGADMEVARYFDLQGREILNPTAGVYLMRKGNKISKVFVK